MRVTMKAFLKALIVVVVLALLLIGGFMGTISFLHARSRHQISQLVAEIRPGTPFSSVLSRLGRESLTLTNASEMESYVTTGQSHTLTNATLHLFVHNAIPMRWICVYTDHESHSVLYASWKDM